MDYKEKYEMALEGIQEILGSGEDSIKMSRLQLRLQGIFPELKESEDDNIRRWIINEIKIKHHNLDEDNVDFVDKAIAWLEKQGEQKQKHFELKAGHWYICHRAYCCRADHLTVKEGERFMCEKDGVVKGFVIKEPEKYFKEVCAPAPMEDEQKYDDKVEPKYEIGDLITNGILVGEIDEIHELGYHAYFGDHYADVPDVENWHKWTIEDAKAGDVLASKDGDDILIFRNVEDNVSFSSYYNIARKLEHYWSKSRFIPATKEQRDLLFKKMHEAGYEWDADKKELKKIACGEQDKINLEKAIWYVENPAPKIVKDSMLVEWLKSLKERVQPQDTAYYNPYKEVVESIAEMCTHYDKASHSGLRDFYDNVKVKCKDAKEYDSLYPQNTWKPSDEQIDALANALSLAKNCGEESVFDLRTLYEQIKKLREE